MKQALKSKKQFHEVVEEKVKTKLAMKNNQQRSTWFGLGMIGMVGWSVVLPTLAGVGIGSWLDKHLDDNYSWTINGLVVGVFAGCAIAWHWVSKENKEINKEK